MTRSMAREGDDRKKKRQRLSATDAEVPIAPSDEENKKIPGSDGGVLKVLEPGEVEGTLRLRSASKKAVNADLSKVKSVESPENSLTEKVKRGRGDTSPEQGSKAVDTLLSLRKLKESERTERPIDNGEPNLKILLQSAVSLSSHAKNVERGANSPDALQRQSLDDLQNYIRKLNGVLEEGWKVEIQRKNKKLKQVRRIYISPSNEKFRSRIEVAKHLGIFGDSDAGNRHLVSDGGSGEGSAARDATDNGRQTAESSQLHREDNGRQTMESSQPHCEDRTTQEEAPTEQNRKDGISASAQSDGELAEIPNSDKRMKGKGTKLVEKLQTERKKHPSAMLITQKCQNVLRDIISAEKFGALSNILSCRSPLGSLEVALQPNAASSISSSLDLQLIALRLATGAYGQTPEMFSADMQQVWKNISSVGNELVTLANILSELSNNLYKEQVLSLFPDESDDGPSNSAPLNEVVDKEEDFLPGSTDMHEHHKQPAKCSFLFLDDSHVMKETEAPPPVQTLSVRGDHKEMKSSLSSKVTARSRIQLCNEHDKRISQSITRKRLNTANAESACKKCGLKQVADGIICTLCNAGYHSHCAASISTEFPDSKWYCPSCAPKAIMQNPDPGNSAQETREVIKHSQEQPLITDQSHDELHDMNLEHLQIAGKRDISSHIASLIQEAREISNIAQEMSLVPDQSDREMSEMSMESLKFTGKGGVCKACGRDDDEVLLCDACDAAYHTNCLVPSVKGVPNGNWYCPVCIKDSKKQVVLDEMGPADGHNCAVCDRISGKALISIKTELAQHPPTSNNENVCKVCGGDGGKKSIIPCSGCEKQYHLSCLKPPIKKVPTGIWFCPSCLCRLCKVDADDDKILLCDSCDEGYHTYCLTPPLTDVPEGSWYCPSCAVSEKQIVKDTSYENTVLDLAENKNMPEMSKRKRKSTEPRRSF